MNKNKLRNQKGSSLFIVMLTLTFVLLSAMGISDILIKEVQMGHIQADSTKAYFAAESGVERVLWEHKKNGFDPRNSSSTDDIFSATLGNDSYYTVNYSSSTDASFFYDRFMSIGTFKTVKRSVEASLKYIK